MFKPCSQRLVERGREGKGGVGSTKELFDCRRTKGKIYSRWTRRSGADDESNVFASYVALSLLRHLAKSPTCFMQVRGVAAFPRVPSASISQECSVK